MLDSLFLPEHCMQKHPHLGPLPPRKGRIANAAKIEMHEAPAEPSELEARVHRDTDES